MFQTTNQEDTSKTQDLKLQKPHWSQGPTSTGLVTGFIAQPKDDSAM